MSKIKFNGVEIPVEEVRAKLAEHNKMQDSDLSCRLCSRGSGNYGQAVITPNTFKWEHHYDVQMELRNIMGWETTRDGENVGNQFEALKFVFSRETLRRIIDLAKRAEAALERGDL
jgi:hypothetical protein